jgi:hypothetical protein
MRPAAAVHDELSIGIGPLGGGYIVACTLVKGNGIPSKGRATDLVSLHFLQLPPHGIMTNVAITIPPIPPAAHQGEKDAHRR